MPFPWPRPRRATAPRSGQRSAVRRLQRAVRFFSVQKTASAQAPAPKTAPYSPTRAGTGRNMPEKAQPLWQPEEAASGCAEQSPCRYNQPRTLRSANTPGQRIDPPARKNDRRHRRLPFRWRKTHGYKAPCRKDGPEAGKKTKKGTRPSQRRSKNRPLSSLPCFFFSCSFPHSVSSGSSLDTHTTRISGFPASCRCSASVTAPISRRLRTSVSGRGLKTKT